MQAHVVHFEVPLSTTATGHVLFSIDKRTPVGDMGFAAYFEDSEGNLMGLWENAI